MPRISYAFFIASAVYGTAGMTWGIWMGATEHMATYPAHAHLNLLGWLGLAVMGTFHALAADVVPRRLARLNFALSATAAVVLPTGIAFIMVGDRRGVPVAVVGGLLALAGMLSFLAAILVAARRDQRRR